jgi:GNAT superfamily N-acetyltransferase
MTSWLAVCVPLGIENNMSNKFIRYATAADVHALAGLHVKTFNETHAPLLRNGPTYAVREYQWQQLFQSVDGSWFCFVIEDANSDLIGFAKGQPYAHPDQPDFAGELNKIYVLREYHRQGLGRRLIGHVARRFLSQAINSMLLFGDARSPSNGFYEALGAERLYSNSGEFHGGYGWRDLRSLVSSCRLA